MLSVSVDEGSGELVDCAEPYDSSLVVSVSVALDSMGVSSSSLSVSSSSSYSSFWLVWCIGKSELLSIVSSESLDQFCDDNGDT